MVDNTIAEWAGIDETALYLFGEGTNYLSYKMLGAHKIASGTRFALWAPNAKRVSLSGDFNSWTTKGYELEKIGTTGVWYGVFSDIVEGMLYKYAVLGADNKTVLKSDPFAFSSELRPKTASIVHNPLMIWHSSMSLSSIL